MSQIWLIGCCKWSATILSPTPTDSSQATLETCLLVPSLQKTWKWTTPCLWRKIAFPRAIVHFHDCCRVAFSSLLYIEGDTCSAMGDAIFNHQGASSTPPFFPQLRLCRTSEITRSCSRLKIPMVPGTVGGALRMRLERSRPGHRDSMSSRAPDPCTLPADPPASLPPARSLSPRLGDRQRTQTPRSPCLTKVKSL